jgi:hypothetical protein
MTRTRVFLAPNPRCGSALLKSVPAVEVLAIVVDRAPGAVRGWLRARGPSCRPAGSNAWLDGARRLGQFCTPLEELWDVVRKFLSGARMPHAPLGRDGVAAVHV